MEVLDDKILEGWERSETSNGLPYYINHNTERTQWDHPFLIRIFEELGGLNGIRYAAYRTAMKLRFLQKRLGFDQVSLQALQTVLERRTLAADIDTVVDCVDLYGILVDILRVARSTAYGLSLEQRAELTLNWLLNLYDVNRTGCIRVVSVKVGIATICSARLLEKYRYFYNQFSGNTNNLSRKRLGCLLHDLVQIPEVMNESQPFGGLNVSAAVESCFSMVRGSTGASEDVFLSWILRQPQTIVWLPTMHRLVAAESVKHESKCNVCKQYPIIGFRYKCLQCFNYDMCQTCFFTGRLAKSHKLKHPTQEYCTATTSKEDTVAFMKTIRNNLSKKHRNKKKLRYLPIYGGKQVLEDEEDARPSDMHHLLTLKANKLSSLRNQPSPSPEIKTKKVADEDNDEKDRKVLPQMSDLERKGIEQIIKDLETENQLLLAEIEQLHRARYGSECGSSEGSGSWPEEIRVRPTGDQLPRAEKDVLRAHNQQLEIQLRKLRFILQRGESSVSKREPLRTVSSNVPREAAIQPKRTSIAVAMTPPRVLQQPPAYVSGSPASSHRSRHSPSVSRGTHPLSSSLLANRRQDNPSLAARRRVMLSYDAMSPQLPVDETSSYRELDGDTSYGSVDGVLSHTHFSLPSRAQSRNFDDEEVELENLIDRLDEVYLQDATNSAIFYGDTTIRNEMWGTVNKMGEAFGGQALEDCLDHSDSTDPIGNQERDELTGEVVKENTDQQLRFLTQEIHTN